MGVGGMVGVLARNYESLSSEIELKNTTVILDTTSALFWLTKNVLLNKNQMDKYGTSMRELGELYTNLLSRLIQHNVRVHVVYEGPRKGERNGSLVSKVRHMESSARSALWQLNQNYLGRINKLPALAMNCFKEVASKLIPFEQLHQAESEVYPLLARLSNKLKAKVLTGHSDFILKNLANGFVWLGDDDNCGVKLSPDSSQPIKGHLFNHQKLLSFFRISSSHSGALGCLAVLLRDDFAETYYDPINKCLKLERSDLKLTPTRSREGIKTRRLFYLLKNWPTNLTDEDSVRSSLLNLAQSGPHLTRDFDGIRDCYSQYEPFEASELARAFQANWRERNGTSQLRDALIKRESSAEFMANVLQKNFDRTGIEDIKTFRSTFSMQDRVKQFLMDRLRPAKGSNELEVFDRHRDALEVRRLRPVSDHPEPAIMNRLNLLWLFHIRPGNLDSVATGVRQATQLDATTSTELALLLLLASFAHRLVPRENYSNQREDLAMPSISGSLGRDRERQMRRLEEYSSSETKKRFLLALLNSCVYWAQSRQTTSAEVRVARSKVDEIAKAPPAPAFAGRERSEASEKYMLCKHLIEALNSTLHAYKELNSLYNFPGPNLPVSKYYDGLLTYKIMARYSRNLQEDHLLTLNDTLWNDM